VGPPVWPFMQCGMSRCDVSAGPAWRQIVTSMRIIVLCPAHTAGQAAVQADAMFAAQVTQVSAGCDFEGRLQAVTAQCCNACCRREGDMFAVPLAWCAMRPRWWFQVLATQNDCWARLHGLPCGAAGCTSCLPCGRLVIVAWSAAWPLGLGWFCLLPHIRGVNVCHVSTSTQIHKDRTCHVLYAQAQVCAIHMGSCFMVALACSLIRHVDRKEWLNTAEAKLPAQSVKAGTNRTGVT
jgi:hypothetical protein